MYVHVQKRDDAPDTRTPVQPLAVMVEHPRTPGALWESIGWNRERSANLESDVERGAFRRNWFTNDQAAD